MRRRQEAISAITALLDKLYNSDRIEEHLLVTAQIFQVMGTWPVPAEKNIDAALCFSSFLRHLGSFSIRRVQGIPAIGLSDLTQAISSTLADFAKLCYPAGSPNL